MELTMEVPQLILKINLASLYHDNGYVRDIFSSLNLGKISSIQSEIVCVKKPAAKGKKLHDTKKTYYKNIYISLSEIYQDNTIITKMFEQFSIESYLIVHYSSDLYWKVYKSDTIPTFKPMISFPINP
jgi:hypothetical protein